MGSIRACCQKLEAGQVIERHDHSVHMSSVLQVQQVYTAGIPLLEGYLQSGFLPMTNNRIRKERLSQVRTKWPLPTWSRFIHMRVVCGR